MIDLTVLSRECFRTFASVKIVLVTRKRQCLRTKGRCGKDQDKDVWTFLEVRDFYQLYLYDENWQ